VRQSGGILFSLLAGQPLVVIMTTAPIAIYIKVSKHFSSCTEIVKVLRDLFLVKGSARQDGTHVNVVLGLRNPHRMYGLVAIAATTLFDAI
jgi:hypothetical protein